MIQLDLYRDNWKLTSTKQSRDCWLQTSPSKPTNTSQLLWQPAVLFQCALELQAHTCHVHECVFPALDMLFAAPFGKCHIAFEPHQAHFVICRVRENGQLNLPTDINCNPVSFTC